MEKGKRQWALPHIQPPHCLLELSSKLALTGGTVKGIKLHSVLGSDIWYLGGGLGEL